MLIKICQLAANPIAELFPRFAVHTYFWQCHKKRYFRAVELVLHSRFFFFFYTTYIAFPHTIFLQHAVLYYGHIHKYFQKVKYLKIIASFSIAGKLKIVNILGILETNFFFIYQRRISRAGEKQIRNVFQRS